MACITRPDSFEFVDGLGIEEISIPAGNIVSIVHKGPYAELEQPYDWLFSQWLPQSGKELGDFPAFEEYLNDPRTTQPADLLTRINCLIA